MQMQPKSISDEAMSRLWQRMTEIYGRTFEASFGHTGGQAYTAWHTSLAGISLMQIKTALEALIAEGHEHPPNLIKFMRLCRENQPASHRAFLPDPPITQTSSVAQTNLTQMREQAGLPEKPLTGWKQMKPVGLME